MSNLSSDSNGEPAAKLAVKQQHQAAANGQTATAEGDDGAATGGGGGGRNSHVPPPRRSSVVVIPPMQVCPGDLLVYSKALTHRSNFNGKFLEITFRILSKTYPTYITEFDGSTQSLAVNASGK